VLFLLKPKIEQVRQLLFSSDQPSHCQDVLATKPILQVQLVVASLHHLLFRQQNFSERLLQGILTEGEGLYNLPLCTKRLRSAAFYTEKIFFSFLQNNPS